MARKGFHYHLEPEKIREYRKLSAEDKLKWLEAAFLFSEMALTPKAKKIRAYFRDGVQPSETIDDSDNPTSRLTANEFLALPKSERRRLMAQQAKEAAQDYEIIEDL